MAAETVISLIVMTGSFDHLHVDVNKDRMTKFLTGQDSHMENVEDSNEAVDLQEITPLFIGNSIMVNVGEELKDRIPNAVIDGEVGRQVRILLIRWGASFTGRNRKYG